jgi:dTDP-4-dehydrorhamnose reductase
VQQRRWLVTGAAGQLGAHVYRALRAMCGPASRVLGTTRTAPVECRGTRRLDLTDGRALAELLDWYQPTHIVHLAGQASPRVVEQDPAPAHLINVDVTRQLASYAGRSDAWLAFSSSDWVFDGSGSARLSEDDSPFPSTVYGRLKLDAERMVLRVPRGLVLRLPLLCGLPVGGLSGTTWGRIRHTLATGGTVDAITDEYRTPVSFADAASILVDLGELGVSGLLHVAGCQVLTPFDVIRALADSVGAAARVRPCRRSDLDAGFERPRWVALDATRLRMALPGFTPALIGVETFAPVVAGPLAQRQMEFR